MTKLAEAKRTAPVKSNAACSGTDTLQASWWSPPEAAGCGDYVQVNIPQSDKEPCLRMLCNMQRWYVICAEPGIQGKAQVRLMTSRFAGAARPRL